MVVLRAKRRESAKARQLLPFYGWALTLFPQSTPPPSPPGQPSSGQRGSEPPGPPLTATSHTPRQRSSLQQQITVKGLGTTTTPLRQNK